MVLAASSYGVRALVLVAIPTERADAEARMGEYTLSAPNRTDMMYTRASALDYDDWKTLHENPGWGSDELIPLLRKVS